MNHDQVDSLRAENATLQAQLSQYQEEQQALQENLEQMRALLKRLYAAQDAEHTSLSRQLHDQAGQALTGLKMDIIWLQNCRVQEDPTVREKLRAMATLADEAVYSLRTIMGELRPAILEEFGLAAVVEWQLQKFQARTGIRYRIQTPAGEPELDRHVSAVLFRVFKELLDNVHRHAFASRVDVSILASDAELIFEVKDNGRGIREAEVNARESLGLFTIREQVSAIGATVHFTAAPGQGTVTTICVPLTTPERG
jgi:signal transduction histidine kinase